MAKVKLEGTYRDVRTGESLDLTSCTQLRTDGLIGFDLFLRDDGETYAKTRLVGRVATATTIDASLFTEYQRSSGGDTITWTTWTADSATLVLRRR